jgi:ceramide glucosyltransferase
VLLLSVSLFFFATSIIGAIYLATAARALAKFARLPCPLATEFLPSVAILKPVAGLEPDLYENLASFCDQDYGGWAEVFFCLHKESDPALAVVEQVIADSPSCRACVVFGENPDLTNPKIANLAKDGVITTRDIVVIADSDVRVGRTFLRALAADFESQRVGAVTCLYSGSPGESIVSRLGALGIDDSFAPSVLVAQRLGELRFCVGAVMAVRGTLLPVIGGLTALGNTFADDNELGRLVTRKGFRVELSRYTVTMTVAETTLGELWAHELRWARTEFALARAGYAVSFLIYTLPMALIYLAVSRDLFVGLALLGIIAVLRLSVHRLARKALGVCGRDDVWLIPLRDFISLGVCVTSLFGRRRTFR